MGGSNEFVECFCWGAVAEGGSGAVVQFVGDGVEVGLVAGDGAPLARETMFSVVAWGLARGEACSALCVSVYRALHNWGCSWGLNPPVSRSARVM